MSADFFSDKVSLKVSHLLLSHDIQIFNQGHKIAVIYILQVLYMLTNYYDCRQHLTDHMCILKHTR